MLKGALEMLQVLESMPLHIDLGVGKDLHDMLLTRAREIDKLVAAHGGDASQTIADTIARLEAQLQAAKDRLAAHEASVQEHTAFMTVIAQQDKAAGRHGTNPEYT